MRRLALAALALTVAVGAVLAVHKGRPDWYVQAMPAWYARAVYPLEHAPLIREAARRNGVDPALVAAVIYAESGFREGAVSDHGAVGLMQLLPSTAEEIAARTGGERFTVDDLRDPRVNIRYGTYYLGSLLDRYDGSRAAALAAYHAGVRRADAWSGRAGAGGLTAADIPFADTRRYVLQVVRLTDVYRRAHDAELGPAP